MLDRRKLLASAAALVASPSVFLHGTSAGLTLSKSVDASFGPPATMEAQTWYHLFQINPPAGQHWSDVFSSVVKYKASGAKRPNST